MMIVSAMLNGVDNRFSRSQPIAPVIANGGGCGARCWPRTK